MTAGKDKRAGLYIPVTVAIGTATLAVLAGLGSPARVPGWAVAVLLAGLTFLLLLHVRKLRRDSARITSILDDQDRENTELISDKGAVLQIMRHRIRSNLQGILGLLQYELATAEEEGARKTIATSIARIMTLSLMEDTLEEGGSLSGLDFGQFVGKVVETVGRMLTGDCASRIVFESEDLILNPDTAFPAGIIIGDLVAGLVEVCTETGNEGSILVRTVREGTDRVHVTVSALGLDVGDADPAEKPIIRNLTAHLSGNIRVSGGGGYLFQLSFPEYFEAGAEMY